MTRMQKAALMVTILDAIRRHGSWCGETNIQKTCYLLQEMLEVPLGFEFVLYKHGPYSFELADELTALRADGILSVQVPNERYGPRYCDGESAAFVKARFPSTIKRQRKKIEFIAEKIGGSGVADLERLATAYFVSKALSGAAVDRRAAHLVRLKPHIAANDAVAATHRIDELILEADKQFDD